MAERVIIGLPVYALLSIWSLQSIKNVNKSINICVDRTSFTWKILTHHYQKKDLKILYQPKPQLS